MEHVHAVATGPDRHVFLIVLWQGGHQLLNGKISLGALIAFYTYLGVLVWPMIALAGSLIFSSVALPPPAASITFSEPPRKSTTAPPPFPRKHLSREKSNSAI